jgi:hypothetical protein
MVKVKKEEEEFKKRINDFLDKYNLHELNKEYIEQLIEDEAKSKAAASKNHKKTREEIRNEYKHQISFLLWSSLMVYFAYHFFVGWGYLKAGLGQILMGKCLPTIPGTEQTAYWLNPGDITTQINVLFGDIPYFGEYASSNINRMAIKHPVCELFRSTYGLLLRAIREKNPLLFAGTTAKLLFPLTLKKAIADGVDVLFDYLDDPKSAMKKKEGEDEDEDEEDEDEELGENTIGYHGETSLDDESSSSSSSSDVSSRSSSKKELEEERKSQEKEFIKSEKPKPKIVVRSPRRTVKASPSKASPSKASPSKASPSKASPSKASPSKASPSTQSRGTRSSARLAAKAASSNRRIRVFSFGSVKGPEITEAEFYENLEKHGLLKKYKRLEKKLEKTCKVKHGGVLTVGLGALSAGIGWLAVKTGVSMWVLSLIGFGGVAVANKGLFSDMYTNYKINTSLPQHTNFVFNLLGIGPNCMHNQSFLSHVGQTFFSSMSLYTVYTLFRELKLGKPVKEDEEDEEDEEEDLNEFTDYAADVYTYLH